MEGVRNSGFPVQGKSHLLNLFLTGINSIIPWTRIALIKFNWTEHETKHETLLKRQKLGNSPCQGDWTHTRMKPLWTTQRGRKEISMRM